MELFSPLSLSIFNLKHRLKTMRKYCIVLMVALLFSLAISAQATQQTYTNETALVALEQVSEKLRSGENNFELDPELCYYLNAHIAHMPEIPANGSYLEKLKPLLNVHTQLGYLFQSMMTEKTDSIPYELALMMSAMGQSTERMFRLSSDFMKTLDKEDKMYTIRLSTYNRSINSARTVILGYVGTTFIANRHEGVNSILIDNLMVFGPKLVKAMPKKDRKALKKEIKAKISPKVNEDLRKEYNLFLKSI